MADSEPPEPQDADRYRSLVEHAHVCIHEIDVDGRITSMNRAGLNMMGCSVEGDVQGMHYLDAVGEADRGRVGTLLARALEGEPAMFEFATSPPAVRHFSSSFIPIADGRGRVLRLMGVTQDITAQKLAEAASARDLAQARSAIAALNDRTEALTEANAELASFAWSISHEMRAPIRSIKSLIDLLLLDHSGHLDPAGLDCARRIQSSAAHMADMMVELLEYSRSGESELKIVPVDLDEVVDRALATLATGDAEIVVERPLGRVMGPLQQLEHVVTHLISNALKFVAPGRRAQVRVSAVVDGPRVRVLVDDNGIGVDPLNQEDIFGVFRRLHPSHEYPGTGIGLAIARRVIDRLGGQLGVEDSPLGGSRFWFQLPAAGARRAEV